MVDLEFEGWVVGGGAAAGAAAVVVAAEGLVAEAVVDGVGEIGLPIETFEKPCLLGLKALKALHSRTEALDATLQRIPNVYRSDGC